MSDPEQQAVYHLNDRPEVRQHIPGWAHSALDVGCGRGGFAATLRDALGPDARLVGIDAVPANVEVARGQGFDEVVEGYFPQAFDGRSDQFDLVTYNDVLEHIVDPWTVLRQTKSFLTPNGTVLAAIPNIQYAPAVLDLVNGHWKYVDSGLLDITHVRFFTRSGSHDLFEEAGYEVLSCVGVNSVWGMEWGPGRAQRSLLTRKAVSLAMRLVLRFRPDSEFLHFVVHARPVGEEPS